MRVPYEVFTDEGNFEKEQEKIFRGAHWCYLGLEAELPNVGDYKSTFLGDTPVVVTRGKDNKISGWVNRCAHRGAMVCRHRFGQADTFTCVYHHWTYSAEGDLLSVPFRRGVAGKGGMPADFDMRNHSLTRLNIDTYKGVIFATFCGSGEIEPLNDYLGKDVCLMLDRIFSRPIRLLGDERQYIHGNWKLYAENIRDAYHASLLHLFHATFGTYRSNQVGGSTLDSKLRHCVNIARMGTEYSTEEAFSGVKSYQEGKFTLKDPSLLKGRADFDDGISLVIMAVFPNLVVQQIGNSLAMRQINPHKVDEHELLWTYFGYTDDDDEMKAIRQKQLNLVGPGGLISMEDGEAVEIVQNAISASNQASSYLAMGGKRGASSDHLISETAVIGFWEYYCEVMG
ncbi:Rieske 2Fe-2S domain-containing protein [Hyphococcus sp.]|uniref:Rieske 2Fe-2S domain-containing protein n=1 Tax=Hyphococcus sp. TaxID=2038636 RepID=UPI0035C70F19